MRQLILIVLSIVIITSCNLVTMSTSEPMTITAPESSHSFQTNDSSFLKLKIIQDKFEIEFFKKVTMIDNIKDLDAFLRNNMTFVDKKKILITNYDTTNNNKDLHDVLEKYGIVNFRVNTDDHP